MKKYDFLRRPISLLLAVVMVLGNVPMQAFAAEGAEPITEPTETTENVEESEAAEILRQAAKDAIFPLGNISGNIAVLGDSTISGYPQYSALSTYLSVADGYTVTDISKAGDTVAGQLNKWNALSVEAKNSLNYVFVQIGLNDMRNLTPESFRTRYKGLIAQIRADSPDAMLILGTMVPCKARWKYLEPNNWEEIQARWESANEDIKNFYYDCDRVAYLHTDALGQDDNLRTEYDHGDHIHPNASGAKVIAYSWYLAAIGHSHRYNSTVTAPTCTEQGYTTYTCACGDSYVADYVNATGHSYKNGICAECDKCAVSEAEFAMDLFVFAGQSNMMGAAVLEPEVNTFTDQSWEYKYMPKLRGAETGAFVPAQNPAGEWHYKDMSAAYGDRLQDLSYKATVSNYSSSTYFCPAMSNGTKGFSAQSEADTYPSASLPPYFVTEYASYGHASAYAHMAKGAVKIVHYFTEEMMTRYNALILEYNTENNKSYSMLTSAGLSGAGDAFDEKFNAMLEDYAAFVPDNALENKCFVWLQGEGDSGNSYIEYKFKMQVLWEHLQKLGFTHFFVLRVGYWGSAGILNVIKAQEDFCAENENCYIVTRAPSLIPYPGATTDNWWISEPSAEYDGCRDSYLVDSGNNHFNEKAMQIFAERSAENIHRILYQGLDPVLEEENIQGLVKEEQKPEEEQPEDTTPYASYVGTDDFNKGLSVSTSSGKWVEKTSSTAASTDLIPVTSDDSVWIQYVFYLSEAHAVGGFYDKDGNLVAPLYYKDFGFSLGGGGGTAAFLTPEATNRVSIADVESATGKEIAYVRFTAWQASAGGHANTEARIYHSHSYTPTVKAPTCTEQGYTTYTCACGDSYVADYVDAVWHSYKDGICSMCGCDMLRVTLEDIVRYQGGVNSENGTLNTTFTNNWYTDIRIPQGAEQVRVLTFKTGANWGSAFFDGATYLSGFCDPKVGGQWIAVDIPDDATVFRYGYLYDEIAQKNEFPVFEYVEFVGEELEDWEPSRYMERPATGQHSFSVEVNIAPAMGDRDGYVKGTDYGYIQLPTNYSPYGEPTRLIIACHGAGASLSNYQTDKWVSTNYSFWTNLGYAVMDMYACPPELTGNNDAQHYGNPVVLECYKKGYDYVLEHFNLKQDGIYLIGASMGGLSSFQIAQSGQFPVIAQVGYCPAIDLFKQAYCSPWTTASYQRSRIASYFDFAGSAPTFTNSKYPSAAEIEFYRQNLDKTLAYSPILRNVVDGDVASIFGVIPSSATAANAEEAAIYAQLTAIHPNPLLIFHNTDDSTVAYRYSQYFVDMVNRSGQEAKLYTFTSGAHNAWANGASVTVQGINGQITIKESQYEAYKFFEKFEKHEEHLPWVDPAVNATCGTTGLTEGSHCASCGEVLVKQDVIPATNAHTYKNGLCTGCGAKDPNGLSLEGLNVLCLGDSITAGQGLTTATRWTNVLASKYGWNLTNKSQGGISMSSYYYTANGQTDVSIAKKAEILKTMTTKPDVIIVWGGHNDTSYRASPLGTWDDETTDSFKGALKYIAELANEYAPDATLFVLTPFLLNEKPSTLKVPANTSDNNWMFVDAIYEGAEIYGWIPINMDLCGITPFTKSGLLLDNIHPNDAGTEKIVAYLSEELATCGESSNKETIIFNMSAVSMKIGENTTLKGILSPRSGTGTTTFTWSSSDSSVATVDASGKITAVAPGTAIVTTTAANGTSAHISVDVRCEHTYKNGICTGCGAEDPNAAQPLPLRYDDHYDITGKEVEIIDAGTPTSYKVGYGVAEGTLDDAVVTLEGNYLAATGTGTANVKIDGTLYEVTVESAPISLLLLIGQSNMQGSEGDENQSIVCPDGMVYTTYGDRYTMTTSNATNFVPSALTGAGSAVNVNGTTANLAEWPIYLLNEAGVGKKGPDSGFAYEWVQQTGEKVWIVNAAHGGSAISTWQDGGANYEECVLLFKACQQTLQKEIDAGHFTLSHMGYFWCQGCSDASQTAEWYVNKYLTMHENLKSALSFDEDTTFEFGGIIPILYGTSSYRAGIYADKNTKPYYESFELLTFNGPRVAQYWMTNNPELPDIWNVCNIGEDWVWMPDGTNGVTEYFQSHYENGTVDYPTQVKQSASWYTPTTPKAVHDSIHYNQIGYNEVGREAARNALIMLGEIVAPDVEITVELLSWDGYTPMEQVTASTAGNSGTLVVPKVYPVWCSKEVAYTLSDGLVWDYYDLLSDSPLTGGVLTADGMDVSVTVTGRELTAYTWELENGTLVSTGDTENTISKVSGSTENGVFIDAQYRFEKSITLLHDQNWVLEWKMTGPWYDAESTASKKLFCEDGASSTPNAMCLLIKGNENRITIGYYNGSTTHISYGLDLDDYGISMTDTHIYRLVNHINDDGTNTVYLFVDGKQIGPMTGYFTGTSGYMGETSDWLSGRDISFGYLGTPKYLLDNGVIEYISVVETGAAQDIHFHDWTEWETVTEPGPEGPGKDRRICSGCGETEVRVVSSIWQTTNILDHWSKLPEELCSGVNLWEILEHDPKYYVNSKGDWGYHSSRDVPSVTISVNPGDRIYATSFGPAKANGHGSSNGIRVTWFGVSGVLKTTDPAGTYAEFTANGGYLVAPEDAVAINIPMWGDVAEHEIFVLSRDHVYEGGICTICGTRISDPVWENGTIASKDGQNSANASRMRTVGYLKLTDYAGVSINSGYTMTNFVYDADYNFLGTSSWLGSGISFTTQQLLEKYPSGVWFRVVFRRDDEKNLTDEAVNTSGVQFYIAGEEVPMPDLGFEVTDVASIGSWQDGAIWNGRLFVLNGAGNGSVVDVKTGGKLAAFTLDGCDVLKPHANSVCFGSTFFAPGDKYPLLYVNIYNNYASSEDRKEGTCCVYRILEKDGVFTTELVQVIRIGFVEDLTLWKSKENNGDVRPYGNFVVDTDAHKLYAFVMRDAEKVIRFFRFDLPGLEEGSYSAEYGCNLVTLNPENIENQFDIGEYSYLQGCCYSNGKILFVGDFGGDAPLRVVDLAQQKVTHTYKLGQVGCRAEPEVLCVDPRDGKLYYAAADGILRIVTLEDVPFRGYLPGDITGDGVVNNKDVTRLHKFLSGYDVEVVAAALDVNGDGAVNNKDLTCLFKYTSGYDVTIH